MSSINPSNLPTTSASPSKPQNPRPSQPTPFFLALLNLNHAITIFQQLGQAHEATRFLNIFNGCKKGDPHLCEAAQSAAAAISDQHADDEPSVLVAKAESDIEEAVRMLQAVPWQERKGYLIMLIERAYEGYCYQNRRRSRASVGRLAVVEEWLLDGGEPNAKGGQ